MYLSLIVVASLLAEKVLAFQGFPIPTSIFGSKPSVDVEAGLHLPKTVVGNKLMLGNTIFLDSNLLPIHDSHFKFGVDDLETKIHLLKKIIDPTHHSVLAQYEFCPITGRRLSKVDHFKQLFNLVDCESDHFKKIFTTLGLSSGALNAHKILEAIGGGITLPVVCETEKKNLFSLLQQFAPSSVSDVVQAELTGVLAAQKIGEFKKLLFLLSVIKPEVFQHFMKSGSECSTPFDTSKVVLDVKEFDDKFKITVNVGPFVTKEEDVQVFFDKEKKLHIKTSHCGKTIPLPSHIDISKTESFLHEGILIINVPKQQLVGDSAITSDWKILGSLLSEDKHPIKVNTI